MAHKLGMHWMRYHQDGKEFEHIAKMRYRSVKVFEWMWNNAGFCNNLVAALRPDAYILARDHPLSEQKEDMWRDPIGTGIRHADEWEKKYDEGKCFLPRDRTFHLGINEPDATAGDRTKIDQYTASFLDELRSHGLRGGAFNFSTGHPRTVDGTPNTAPDYAFFYRAHDAIVRGGHIAVQHIYGTAAVPCAEGHYDRLKSCPWNDVQWVIGEFGIDEHVVGGGDHHGFHVPMAGNLPAYCDWLDTAMQCSDDPRIHSFQVFTFDFSHPWETFDVAAIQDAMESHAWHDGDTTPAPQPPKPTGALNHPLPGAVITQRFGENPEDYARFGQIGHNGVDLATSAEYVPVLAVADGTVAYNGYDDDYGWYCRIAHPDLRFYSFYAHLMNQSPVRAGQVVRAGGQIGIVGSTGNSTGPHLHLEVRLMADNGEYAQAQFGYSKGRVDPQSALYVLGLSL